MRFFQLLHFANCKISTFLCFHCSIFRIAYCFRNNYFFVYICNTLKKKSYIYKTIISVFFLALFLQAIGKNIVCGLEHLPVFNREHTHAHNHNDGEHSHSKAHKHETPAASHNHKAHEHKHDHGKKKSEDDCCKKIAAVFYSSLTKPFQEKFDFIKTLENKSGVFNQSLLSLTVSSKKADYYSWKAPPPKIPDIRVFISSFLI